ncbi:type IV secretion system DNA-binding domain-containing protein, partial [Burkholderia cenocepacia]|uniref:type IV secretion system DNA-binding domain-containing protein n=1 Tax=Burkholderia cenocepacia TaxID=95486 RepID=UPI00155A012A
LIEASIKSGLKTVILDPGSEWTKYFFDENDPSIALIDPTDARSHVWNFVSDMKGLGFWTKFVASVIPSQGKD